MKYEEIKINTHFCLILGKLGNAFGLAALGIAILGGF